MIFYAAYYSTKDSGRVKNYAGEDKIDYICHVLNNIGEDVLILSNAKTTKREYAKREIIHLFSHTQLLYFASLPMINKPIHALDVLWGYLQLIVFVIFKVKKDDTVLVYHSLGYRGLWGFLKRIKKLNYILEVEELYQTFKATVSGYKKHENEVFKYPDAFLFSNIFLEEKINNNKKPFAIINGIYQSNDFVKKQRNKTIRVVYAGSLEKQKGVDFIIKTASYLPKEYELHIIGFGSNNDIDRVKSLIQNCTTENNANITYDGVFKGQEYLSFLQSCDIGICIQDEKDDFNKYEYPSKIFSYLSNGLQVVANNLIQLQRSAVYPYLHISNSTKPKDIAKAIMSCKNNYIDSTTILEKLDNDFKTHLKQIIKGGK